MDSTISPKSSAERAYFCSHFKQTAKISKTVYISSADETLKGGVYQLYRETKGDVEAENFQNLATSEFVDANGVYRLDDPLTTAHEYLCIVSSVPGAQLRLRQFKVDQDEVDPHLNPKTSYGQGSFFDSEPWSKSTDIFRH